MKNNENLKTFFIKLAGIVVSIIIVINVLYNTIIANKIESINYLLSLNKKENLEQVKIKVRKEIRDGLEKDRILDTEDAKLFKELYFKLKKELKITD